MKTNIFRTGLALIALSILFLSCNENKPTTDQMSWSPDGTKLALVTTESNELLIAVVNDKSIENIVVVDKSKQEKMSSPQWSPSGKFVLYYKAGKENTEIYTFSLASGEKHFIATLPKTNDNFSQPIAAWSPQKDQILYVTNKAAQNIFQLNSSTADGRQKKVLTEFKGEFSGCHRASEGEWITVSLKADSNTKSTSIWKIKTDSTVRERIYDGNSVSTFAWSPDGSRLAVVNQIREPKDSTDVLILMDPNGKNEQVACRMEPAISRIEWSPKGNFISIIQAGKDKQNLLVIETTTLQSAKITFDNLDNYFGWDGAEKLFFTVDIPESPLNVSSPEKDYREFIDAMQGIKNENLLICRDRSGIQRVDKNIYSFEKFDAGNRTAYFIPYDVKFLSSESYMPVIRFSNNDFKFITRTNSENLGAADLYFQNQKFENSLEEMSAYWGVDFTSPDFRQKFNTEEAFRIMQSNADSLQLKQLFAGLKNGALLRTIIILRNVNQNEEAEWLFDQFLALSTFYSKHPIFEKEKDDAIVWSYIETYLKYGCQESGIRDLDELISRSQSDSLAQFQLYFAQSILAFENGNAGLSIDKLAQSLDFISQNADTDDLLSFLAIPLLHSNETSAKTYTQLMQKLVTHLSDSSDVQQAHELTGDFFLNQNNSQDALAAYQRAATAHFDPYKIWTKIFETESP